MSQNITSLEARLDKSGSSCSLKTYVSTLFNKATEEMKVLLRDTSIETYLFSVVGAVCAMFLSYSYEVERSHTIPLAFSEITQIESRAVLDGTEVGPLTEYYAKLNDVVMKTLDAWNKSWEGNPKTNHIQLGEEFKARTTRNPMLCFYEDYTINDLLDTLPELASNAFQSMKDFNRHLPLITSIKKEFEASWAESHYDHNKTVYYTDSDGKEYSSQEYDYTTHSYYYYPEHGEKASVLLSELAIRLAEFKWPEILLKASDVSEENKNAIIRSMSKADIPTFTQSEFLALANAWNTGSTYNQNKPIIYSSLEKVPEFDKKWQVMKGQASSISYNTGSHFDSGPDEYSEANQILESIGSLEHGIAEIVNGMKLVKSEAPELKKSIENYISALNNLESTSSTFNPAQAQKEIFKTVKTWYNVNIKEGLDVDMFRWHCILLWGLFGALAGAGLGFGIDKIGDKYRWYGESRARNYFDVYR